MGRGPDICCNKFSLSQITPEGHSDSGSSAQRDDGHGGGYGKEEYDTLMF